MAFLKNKFEFTDNIITKILLSKDFEPKNNKVVQEIIDNIDNEANNLTNFPKINETYPKLNLNQLNIFLESLKMVFAVNNEPVIIDEIHFYQKVPIKREKYKWEDYLVINNLEIKADFINLSIPVITSFFVNPEFDEVSYDNKLQVSEEFLKEFERQTGLPKNQLAIIPTDVEVDNDNLSVINPNLKKEQEQPTRLRQDKCDADQSKADFYKLLMLKNRTTQTKSHLVPLLVGILSIVLIASVGMIGGLIYQNQTLNSQNISRLSKYTIEMSKKLESSNEKLMKNKNEKDQLKSQLQKQQD